MQYLSYALPLAAIVGGSYAMPGLTGAPAACTSNACLAAVTGKAALGDDSLRGNHCASFLATTVTPPAVTSTVTITGKPENKEWKRASVTVCPNEVPNYASACDEAAYTSACSCFGFTAIKTTTIAPTTTTKTIYVRPTDGSGTCDGDGTKTVTVGKETVTVGGKTVTVGKETVTVDGKTVTVGKETVTVGKETVTVTPSGAVTVTVTKGGWTSGFSGYSSCTDTVTVGKETVTVTPSDAVTVTVTKGGYTGSSSGYSGCTDTVTVTPSYSTATVTVTKEYSTTSYAPVPTESSCLTDEKAEEMVDAFINFLEFTSYPGGPLGAPGRGYNFELSNATFASDFSDISDSINFMAGNALGSVTFASPDAFVQGQGLGQPEVAVETLNIWHDCHSITWRWKITLPIPNSFPVVGINYMIVDEEGKLAKNYAEFDNGAWLQSFGQTCALRPVTTTSPNALKRDLLRHY